MEHELHVDFFPLHLCSQMTMPLYSRMKNRVKSFLHRCHRDAAVGLASVVAGEDVFAVVGDATVVVFRAFVAIIATVSVDAVTALVGASTAFAGAAVKYAGRCAGAVNFHVLVAARSLAGDSHFCHLLSQQTGNAKQKMAMKVVCSAAVMGLMAAD